MTNDLNTRPRRPENWPLDCVYTPQVPARATTAFINRVFERYGPRLTADGRTTLIPLLRSGDREEAEEWLSILCPRLPAPAVARVCDWLTDGWCRDELIVWWYRTYRNWTASDGMPKPLVFHWENA